MNMLRLVYVLLTSSMLVTISHAQHQVSESEPIAALIASGEVLVESPRTRLQHQRGRIDQLARIVKVKSKFPLLLVEQAGGRTLSVSAADHLIITTAEGITPDFEQQLLKAGVSRVQAIAVNTYLVEVAIAQPRHASAFEVLPTVEKKLRNIPGVLSTERNTLVATATIPHDPRFAELYALNNLGQTAGTTDADIDAPEAWQITTSAPDMVLAVIDTGVDYVHEDLAANMWTNPLEAAGIPGVDDDQNGYVDDIHGFDFANADGDPMDDHGHGTHCAGIAAAVGNNGIGVTGVCWATQIMAVKFISASGVGYTSDAIAAVQYVTKMRQRGTNIRVSSNSWGGGGYNQALYNAIEALTNQDVLFVAAAGNEATDNDLMPQYPASYDLSHIVSVAASDEADRRSWFSCWGYRSVDVAAPGSNILSCAPGNSYVVRSGTSMATPHVAAALQMMINLAADQPAISSVETLKMSVDPLPAFARSATPIGSAGRINLARALENMAPTPRGSLRMDRLVYPLFGSVQISLRDHQLAGQSVQLPIATQSDSERIDFVETSTPGEFVASVPLGPGPALHADGRLQVANGDVITVTYNDADDGTQAAVRVVATAMVDGLVPSGNVEIDAGVFQAEVQIDASEPVSAVLQYESDGVPVGTISRSGRLDQQHLLVVADLLPDTSYRLRVRLTDAAGNETVLPGAVGSYEVHTKVAPSDYFTELFSRSDQDLEYTTLLLTPDARPNAYTACWRQATELPGGADGQPVELTDDSYARVELGQAVYLYGQTYTEMFVGSNGYVTFGTGDTEYTATLAAHFQQPRVAMWFDDFDPPPGGVRIKESGDHVAVTFLAVPQFDETDQNTFQLQMFHDGRIQMTWLQLPSRSGLAGLSAGEGEPRNYVKSDLSALAVCSPAVPVARHATLSGRPNEPLVFYLPAADDGTPDPPGELLATLVSLPAVGTIHDAAGQQVTDLPAVRSVGELFTYHPPVGFRGTTQFAYVVDDGGSPPTGGVSEVGIITVEIVDPPPDMYTEWFFTGNDVAFSSVTFIPSAAGVGYVACRNVITELPTSAEGGIVLPLNDDDSQIVPLPQAIRFFGREYNDVYVGSNGYVTFGRGDTAQLESPGQHWLLPRVSGLFDDLEPPPGSVRYKLLTDRIAVTYDRVPEFDTQNENTLQIELFYDGTVRLSWLGLAVDDGLVGLSDGIGPVNELPMSDFSSYKTCIPSDPPPTLLTVVSRLAHGAN